MVNPDNIVVDGWDISDMNLAESMKRAQVLEPTVQSQLQTHLAKLKPRKTIYIPDFIAANQVSLQSVLFYHKATLGNRLEAPTTGTPESPRSSFFITKGESRRPPKKNSKGRLFHLCFRIFEIVYNLPNGDFSKNLNIFRQKEQTMC